MLSFRQTGIDNLVIRTRDVKQAGFAVLKSLFMPAVLVEIGFLTNKEDLRYVWSYELQILGANGWMCEELEALIQMVASGELTPVVDRVLPLDEVNEAFRLIEDREIFGKVVLTPNG